MLWALRPDGSPACRQNPEVAHSPQPVAQVIGQVQAEAVAAVSSRIEVLVFVTHKELRFGCRLGTSRTRRKEHEYPCDQEITHFPSMFWFALGNPTCVDRSAMFRECQASRQRRHAPMCSAAAGREGRTRSRISL